MKQQFLDIGQTAAQTVILEKKEAKKVKSMTDQTLLPGGNYQASLQGQKFEIGFRGLTVLKRKTEQGEAENLQSEFEE